MTCFECGAKAKEKHHLIPKSLGGTRTVPLCGFCHCKIHGVGGSRIEAVDLSKLGIYRKNAISFLAVMAWDKVHVKWAIVTDDHYKSYQLFSGDYKLTKSQFHNRLKLIGQWEYERRWEWFMNIFESQPPEQVLLSVKILYEKHRVTKFNKCLKDGKKVQDYTIRGLMTRAFGGAWPQARKMDWRFNDTARYPIEWNGSYDDYVIKNIWTNIDDRDSRFKLKREIADHEKQWKIQRKNERLVQATMRGIFYLR
jgi:hypothetical protein